MIYKILRPLLFKIDAEKAHNLAIKYLKFLPKFATLLTIEKKYDNLKNTVFGLDFTNPIGMSAGFDKNCEIAQTIEKFGFGFVEVGTTTPLPQIGNDKPRIFRLIQEQAIINRLGFNNLGSEIFFENLKKIKANFPKILGVNIGKNKDTLDPFTDYIELLKKFYNYADYLTINISSPNTKNLRDLQNKDQLSELLTAIDNCKIQLQKDFKKNTPILLKIAPDLDDEQLQQIAKVVLNSQISGVIISNTTIDRNQNLSSDNAKEQGGLSGKPLFDKSTDLLKKFYKLTDGKVPLIGVGGISNAQDVYQKIRCGASLVQIYSAVIFQGFGLIEDIKKELSLMLQKDSFQNIHQAIGIDNK